MLPVDATVADDHSKWGVKFQQREERGQVEGRGYGPCDVARPRVETRCEYFQIRILLILMLMGSHCHCTTGMRWVGEDELETFTRDRRCDLW